MDMLAAIASCGVAGITISAALGTDSRIQQSFLFGVAVWTVIVANHFYHGDPK
tara:strand:+ start:1409 stop:1567 length:159 start_codon:yes stop_codon:yes gene_type:complete